MGCDCLHKSFDLNIHLNLQKTAEMSKSFENKNGHRAILTGLPNFLGGEGDCTHSGHQACHLPLRDIASHVRVKHLLI